MRSSLHHLARRGTAQTWYCLKAIPKELRPAFGGKHHLIKNLQTTDKAVALARRTAALDELENAIRRARQPAKVADMMEAAKVLSQARRELQPGDSFGAWVWQDGVDQAADEAAGRYGPAVAKAFLGVATGTATALQDNVDAWLSEPGLKGPLPDKTKKPRRAILKHLEDWLTSNGHPVTVEAVTKQIAGSYIKDTFITPAVDPVTANSRISPLSSYWRWLQKRVGVEINPWAGQSFRKPSKRTGGEKNKRPFTESEMITLLTGPANQDMQDVIRIASLTGLRRGEIFALQFLDCANGLFDITASKSEAGVRKFPIHSALLPIIARRSEGRKPTDFLFAMGAKHKGDAFGKAFKRYRTALGVVDKVEGRRQERIDFHRFRSWFTTEARKRFDYAIVTSIIGHENGNVTDDTYNAGPDIETKRACVESVQLPPREVQIK